MGYTLGSILVFIALFISASSIYSGNLYNLSHNVTVRLHHKGGLNDFNVAPTLAVLLCIQTLAYFFAFHFVGTGSGTDLIITIVSFSLQFIRFMYLVAVLDKNREMELYFKINTRGELLDVITNAFCFAHILLIFL